MADLSLTLDVGDLEVAAEKLGQLDKLLHLTAKRLAGQTHAKIAEQAQVKLHTRRASYLENLKEPVEIAPGVWMITLLAPAGWIEMGMPQHSMVKDLLRQSSRGNSKSGPKRAKDGCVLNPRNKVLTNLGWKKIKDIVAGDMVLSHSGKFREVKELLVRPAGIGTEYVRIRPKTAGPGNASKVNSDLTLPALSLTIDHPVLTPEGWKPAGELKKDDLIATPADLLRRCRSCHAPLPINAKLTQYCLNNKCARRASVLEGRALPINKEDRRRNGIKANKAARDSGCFDRPDWGARNPSHLKKMRDASSKSMRAALSHGGSWRPEAYFEKCLNEAMVSYEREIPIETDRIVNAGRGMTRKSILYGDFYIPRLRLLIELDGTKWHSRPEQIERDRAKDEACREADVRILRVPSHKIYKIGQEMARHLALWIKNHSSEIGLAWVRVGSIKKGVVNRADHVYAKKYDIVLDADEHSFCCETVFIHNSTYRVIPFVKNKGPASQTMAEQTLTATIKKELKTRGIPYAKIERNDDGSAKTGMLHSFGMGGKNNRGYMPTPNRPDFGVATPNLGNVAGKPPNDHGFGRGAIGAPMVGPTGTPLLQGVRIYQNPIFEKAGDGRTIPKTDKKGQQMVNRSILTFRIVSSKHEGVKWEHPGMEGMRFFDQGLIWAQREWETKFLPDIKSALGVD
jgi:hypothetical protein